MVKIATFGSELLPLSSIWKFVWLKAVKEEQPNFKDKFNLRIVTYIPVTKRIQRRLFSYWLGK